MRKCPNCNGDGLEVDERSYPSQLTKCSLCYGKGKINNKEYMAYVRSFKRKKRDEDEYNYFFNKIY